MDGTTSNILATQLTAAAVSAYLMRLIQKWAKLPWITEHTAGINAAFRAVVSLAATLGISFTWDGTAHTLLISGLTFSTIAIGLWHWLGQFSFTHMAAKVFEVNDPARPPAIGNIPPDTVIKPEPQP